MAKRIFFQIVALIGGFELGYKSDNHRAQLLTGLEQLNFNPQLSYLDCLLGWHWEQMWWLKGCLPLIVVGTYLLCHFAHKAFCAMFKRVPKGGALHPVTASFRSTDT